jgi:hypothetical protein
MAGGENATTRAAPAFHPWGGSLFGSAKADRLPDGFAMSPRKAIAWIVCWALCLAWLSCYWGEIPSYTTRLNEPLEHRLLAGLLFVGFFLAWIVAYPRR